MKKEQKINNRLVIILFITIIVAALVTSWKVEDYGEKLINKKDTGIDSEKRELYNMLMTSSKEYGFYFNDNVNIENISDERMIEYSLEQYVFDNNISMSNELTICVEETYDSDILSEDCLTGIKESTIKKSDLDNYIKNKFNTDRIFIPEKGENSNFGEGTINGYSTGEYLYDFNNEVYYVGYLAKSGSTPELHNNLIKVEKENDNIYFYDNVIYCDLTPEVGVWCFPYINNEMDEDKAIIYMYPEDLEEGKKIDALRYEIKKDDEGNEYEDYSVNTEYIFKNFKDKLNTYKHTFKKSKDGKYYWYSSEIVK